MLSRKHANIPAFVTSLHLHFPVRLHATLLLVAATCAGLLVSRLLLLAGMESPILRFPVAVTSAYAFFLLFVNAWLWWIGVKRSRPEPAESAPDPEGSSSEGRRSPRELRTGNKKADNVGDVLDGVSNLDFSTEGFVILILVAAVAAGGWAIAAMPEVLVETAIDVAIASGLIRSMSPTWSEFWFDDLLARTLWKGVILALVAFFVGVAVRFIDPGAVTVGQAVRQMLQR